MRIRRLARRLVPVAAVGAAVLVWTFFVLYPNPLVLVRSVEHVSHPTVDPQAVAGVAQRLPNDPRRIERAVLDRIVPYAYDWQTAGVPWYFPTVREAVAQGRGDCESRAIVLASILAYKHIPYQLRMSFDHIWVDYPGKQANALENNSVVLAQRVNGHYVWRWPSIHLGAEVRAQIADYWTPMPLGRKLLLFGGIGVIVVAPPLVCRRRRLGAVAGGIAGSPTRRGARDRAA